MHRGDEAEGDGDGRKVCVCVETEREVENVDGEEGTTKGKSNIQEREER